MFFLRRHSIVQLGLDQRAILRKVRHLKSTLVLKF